MTFRIVFKNGKNINPEENLPLTFSKKKEEKLASNLIQHTTVFLPYKTFLSVYVNEHVLRSVLEND